MYDYEKVDSEPKKTIAKNINPYLLNAPDVVLLKRRKPLCNVSEISFGSMPNDGGEFLLTTAEKDDFLNLEPKAKKYIKPLISAHEFINGKKRWCLWLKDAKKDDLKSLSEVKKRVQNVKNTRLKSSRPTTQKLAKTPHLFGEIRQPESDFVFIPLTSSENRSYIPMGFFEKNSIANNSASIIPDASLFEFGVLISKMHMTWMSFTCGRLESRYRYSNEIVYNNFPWPNELITNQKKSVESKAHVVLEERKKYPDKTLAKLYNPKTMPAGLLKAHQELDKAVDLCYSDQSFKTEKKRMEFLFKEYDKLI